jgi:hypothetical protein
MVRAGLRRRGAGVDGQALADGETCWRCRAKQARKGMPKSVQLPTGPVLDQGATLSSVGHATAAAMSLGAKFKRPREHYAAAGRKGAMERERRKLAKKLAHARRPT